MGEMARSGLIMRREFGNVQMNAANAKGVQVLSTIMKELKVTSVEHTRQERTMFRIAPRKLIGQLVPKNVIVDGSIRLGILVETTMDLIAGMFVVIKQTQNYNRTTQSCY